MQKIYLTCNLSLWCIVDPVDYEWASRYVWNYKPRWSLLGLHYYAKRNVGPARLPLYLHRLICERAHGLAPDGKPLADHRSGNTLDCRRANLRWVTHRQNAQNIGGRSFLIEPPLIELDALPGW